MGYQIGVRIRDCYRKLTNLASTLLLINKRLDADCTLGRCTMLGDLILRGSLYLEFLLRSCSSLADHVLRATRGGLIHRRAV